MVKNQTCVLWIQTCFIVYIKTDDIYRCCGRYWNYIKTLPKILKLDLVVQIMN